jgi:hypothetical protein
MVVVVVLLAVVVLVEVMVVVLLTEVVVETVTVELVLVVGRVGSRPPSSQKVCAADASTPFGHCTPASPSPTSALASPALTCPPALDAAAASSVFGCRLQCQPVRGVNARDE